MVPLTLALNDSAAAAHHQRSQYRRQDGGTQDHRAAGHDGPGGNSGARGGGVFPLFDAFLADIGDAQSIEQNLSTFSAHITNLERISQLADSSSLVLLDELGSATDPEEGAALAVAIAEYFLDRRAWCLISTHHTSLKLYAAKGRECSMLRWGSTRRRWRQRLLCGWVFLALRPASILPSAWVSIPPSLPMPGDNRTRRRRISPTSWTSCTASSTLSAGEREELRRREQEVAREKNRLESEGLKEWRAKVRDLESQLQSLLKDFTYQIRETVRAIDDRAAQQKLSKEAERRMARLRREFSEQFNSVGGGTTQRGRPGRQQRAATPGAACVDWGYGEAEVAGQDRRWCSGRLDGNAFEVAVGPMKMRVAREDIAEVVAGREIRAVSPLEAARGRGVTVSIAHPEETVRPEINVIGRTVEEATGEVEQYLDRAFLAGLPRVRIVHGMGMGVLRKALRALMERHPHVALVGEAGPSEGGAGATVVDLRV